MCEYCGAPLDPDARSDARFCSPAHRAAAHRAKRQAREDSLAEQVAYARNWLRRQTAALKAGDLDVLDELSREAEAYFAALEA